MERHGTSLPKVVGAYLSMAEVKLLKTDAAHPKTQDSHYMTAGD